MSDDKNSVLEQVLNIIITAILIIILVKSFFNEELLSAKKEILAGVFILFINMVYSMSYKLIKIINIYINKTIVSFNKIKMKTILEKEFDSIMEILEINNMDLLKYKLKILIYYIEEKNSTSKFDDKKIIEILKYFSNDENKNSKILNLLLEIKKNICYYSKNIEYIEKEFVRILIEKDSL